MLNWISSWASEVVIVVIIISLIEMILPEGNNKKYIKTIMGIFILFAIISPVVSKVLNKDINLNKVLQELNVKPDTYQASSNSVVDNTEFEQIYKQNLVNDIKEKLKQKNYITKKIDLEVEVKDDKKYGKINKISITINNSNKEIQTTKNEIELVEKIDINVSNMVVTNNLVEEIKVSQLQINEIKKYISETYDVKEELITIN